MIEALRTRRSIGRLEGEVPESDIRELIELAALAPNHKLTEPWRFTVLRGAARVRLGRLWAEILGRETDLSGAAREEMLRGAAAKLLRAPAIVVVSVRTDPNPVMAAEDFAAAAAATENLLLAAHAKGYGAMWRTGGITRQSEVAAFLGLGEGDRIVAMVYLGRPAMPAPPVRPRNVETALRFIDE